MAHIASDRNRITIIIFGKHEHRAELVLLSLDPSTVANTISLASWFAGEEFVRVMSHMRVWHVRPGGIALQFHHNQDRGHFGLPAAPVAPSLEDVDDEYAMFSGDDEDDIFGEPPPTAFGPAGGAIVPYVPPAGAVVPFTDDDHTLPFLASDQPLALVVGTTRSLVEELVKLEAWSECDKFVRALRLTSFHDGAVGGLVQNGILSVREDEFGEEELALNVASCSTWGTILLGSPKLLCSLESAHVPMARWSKLELVQHLLKREWRARPVADVPKVFQQGGEKIFLSSTLPSPSPTCSVWPWRPSYSKSPAACRQLLTRVLTSTTRPCSLQRICTGWPLRLLPWVMK